MIGLLAATLTGLGEFLLHYDPLARFAGDAAPYAFFLDTSIERLSAGHFIAILGIPLYLVGCWHIYLMLKPGGRNLAFSTFLVGSYGFIVGGAWLGSRALIARIVQSSDPSLAPLVDFYEGHYESLLQVIRITTLLISIAIGWLVIKGNTRLPRWMAAVTPIFGILACFAIFLLLPAIGKYIMPIALNVAFFVFFSCSLVFGNHESETSIEV